MNLIIILYIVGFIRTVVFILAVYFIIKLFARYILPLILEKKIKEMQHDMNDRMRSHNSSNRREGEVTIDYEPQKSNKPHRHDEGEYVDFEEVD